MLRSSTAAKDSDLDDKYVIKCYKIMDILINFCCRLDKY